MRNNTHRGSCDAPGTADLHIGAVTTAIKTLERGRNAPYWGDKQERESLATFFNLFSHCDSDNCRLGVSPKIVKSACGDPQRRLL